MSRPLAHGLLLSLSFSLVLAAPGFAQSADTKAAQTAAGEWLALVDAGGYAESWTTSAATFRKAVPQTKWEGMVQAVRQPLGKMKTRSVRSATSATTLPGAPDGQYVVFQYDGSFEHKTAAVETLTTVLEPDGTWRVVGYFIK